MIGYAALAATEEKMAEFDMQWIGSESSDVLSGIASYIVGVDEFEIALPSFNDALKINQMLHASQALGERIATERIARRVRDALNA